MSCQWPPGGLAWALKKSELGRDLSGVVSKEAVMHDGQ